MLDGKAESDEVNRRGIDRLRGRLTGVLHSVSIVGKAVDITKHRHLLVMLRKQPAARFGASRGGFKVGMRGSFFAKKESTAADARL